MKKFITILFTLYSTLFLYYGCSNKVLPHERIGSISESYTGIVTMVEPVQVHGDGTVTSLLGMIAGGVLGNQIGGGSGKDVATMSGTILGAVAGANADIQNAQRITIQFDSGNNITTILPLDNNNPVMFKKGDRVTVYITNGKVTEIR